jgi:hypothetical protein
MARKLWFKAKTYGYGWVPCTWEGWAVTIGYIVLLLVPSTILLLIGIDTNQSGAAFAAFFLPYASILTGLLIWISAAKGEEARWRWGK